MTSVIWPLSQAGSNKRMLSSRAAQTARDLATVNPRLLALKRPPESMSDQLFRASTRESNCEVPRHSLGMTRGESFST
jgi:hypothetical protein